MKHLLSMIVLIGISGIVRAEAPAVRAIGAPPDTSCFLADPSLCANPCSVADARHVPCVYGQTYNLNHLSSSTITAKPVIGMPWQGNTPATVNSQFVPIMNWVFSTTPAATLNAKMTAMKPIDLARFTSAYGAVSTNGFSELNVWAKAKFSAANWARWQAAVNPATPVAATLKQSYAHYIQRRINPKIQWGLWPAANPTIDMTLREIYNEFMWTSAATEVEALIATATYAAVNLKLAFALGYGIGSGFYAFANTINSNYGYDLVTTYGDENFIDYGTPTGIVTIEWGSLTTDWSSFASQDNWDLTP